MIEQEKQQISNIISNFLENKWFFPYVIDLEEHPTFGVFFRNLDTAQKDQIEEIINNLIVEKIQSYKTKWWELFRRFFEINEADFWRFREMNCNDNFAQTKEFQELWRKLEGEIFKYEWILTERMLEQEKGLDKVVGSFYNIVYSYFPKLNLVESE